MKRISNLQLGQIDLSLTPLDRHILSTLKEFRYMKTGQIQQLFYPPLICTPRAALTAATRNLHRLKRLGLVNHLEKKVGGVMGGSQGLIWFVTEAGSRLLLIGTEQEGTRKRLQEPSPLFLRHILAVAECYIQIATLCKKEPEMNLIKIEKEPLCWRSYDYQGRAISLRPDLYLETSSAGYNDYWFIEMDLGTESTRDILEKCKRYHQYRLSSNEQKKNGVFPVVLFVVPDQERKEKITETIKDNFRVKTTRIFLIITPEELHKTIKNGALPDALC
ncbi:MAG: replication-relaxation family protein [Bacteroidaceae bacterium]|nr:replication-relaxation family protein [Bacteroidaceae bacterium]MBR3642318.1 replication-relaxation family protein [Parasporobacterium sp.]